MKTKLFVGFGLIIATIGLSLVFGASTVQAKGEKYKWIDATTIEGSGGKYEGIPALSGKPAKFTGSNTIYTVTISCNNCKFTITTSLDNKTGTLKVISCNLGGNNCSELKDAYDQTFTIANPEKGPPAGTNIDYTTVNCSAIFNSADIALQQCEAVKSCITVAGKKKEECLAAWVGCTTKANADGTITFDEYQKCRTRISTGDLTDTLPPPAPTTTTKKTSCAIDGVGWIICPVITLLANLVDGAYELVDSLLKVQPLLATGGSTSIYEAWSIMRNFANVAFVIAFLIVIFSQITGVGITNYGIKKLLPRIIVAAILVNVSYWICAVAIDVSNILGSSIKELFESIGVALTPPGKFSEAQTGTKWGGLTTFILGGGLVAAALYVGLSALLPILITALLAIITVFIALALRQALVILLIIVSPLAFVAYLLPNTQPLFDKWRKAGQAVLILYPAISLVFGAADLASDAITASAASIDNAGQKFAVQAMGAGIQIIPIPVALVLVKKVFGFLDKMGITDPSKGLVDRLQKGAEGVRNRQEGRREIRALGSGRTFGLGKYQRAAKRSAINAGVEAERKRAQTSYVASEARNDDAFRNRLAGGLSTSAIATPAALNRALASAISVQAQIEADEVKAASAVIKNANISQEQMRELAHGGRVGSLDGSSVAIRAAAMRNVIDTHDITGVNQLLDRASLASTDPDSMDAKTRESLADSLAGSSAKPSYVSQGAIADIRRHEETDPATGVTTTASNSTQLAIAAINNNTYSAEKIATGDREELEFIEGVASEPTNHTNNARIAANAALALSDPKYRGQVSKNETVATHMTYL